MTTPVRMHGIAASPGIAVGRARLIDREKIKLPKRRISPARVQAEVDRLKGAIEESRRQLLDAKNALQGVESGTVDHTLILDAHLLMLDDELLIRGTSSIVSSELINAEWALFKKTREIQNALAGLGDEYFRERIEDVEFVSSRIVRNLMGHATKIVDDFPEPCIIVADNLSPVETTQMIGSSVLGFGTEMGTSTSHTSIMAQALGIPAVVGVESLTERIAAGEIVIIDGYEGAVIIGPDAETLKEYRDRAAKRAELEKKLLSHKEQPAVTLDGVRISLLANIEFPAEAAMALDYGAEGVGLYRTEFLYFNRTEPPSEEEQYRTFRIVAETLAPRPVVFRTFDLGADKLPAKTVSDEVNPALGLRAIRLGLKDRAMFKTHLKALLRAANHGKLEIMFPMISGLGELRQVKALLKEVQTEMGPDAPSEVRIGCMIELPSAVLTADRLAREVDFFSIGTNDLIQYSLAIDRTNDHVAYLYTPFHPVILRSLKMVIDAGKQAAIPVAICGSLAAEPLFIPLLVGLGLRIVSMAPTSIPMVKSIVRKIDCAQAEKLTAAALELDTPDEVEDLVRDYTKKQIGSDY